MKCGFSASLGILIIVACSLTLLICFVISSYTVYDVARKDTFDSLSMWLQEVQQFSMGGGEQVVKLLVGNKIDQERAVSREVRKRATSFENLHLFSSTLYVHSFLCFPLLITLLSTLSR